MRVAPPVTAYSQFGTPCQPLLHLLVEVTARSVIGEMEPVYNLDTNVITPHGAMPIRLLKVAWFL